jgi:DUF1680 family protein
VNLKNGTVKIEQQTDYPWHGNVRIKINPEKNGNFTLYLRMPGWTQNKVLPSDLYSYSDTVNSKVIITLNSKEIKYNISTQGYAAITRIWKPNDSINISFSMCIRRVLANKKVKDDENLAALEYGPLLYCVEGIDNNNQINNLTIPVQSVLKLEKKNELLDGVDVITSDVPAKNGHGVLKLTAIPYYAWSNRDAGTMKVWLPQN